MSGSWGRVATGNGQSTINLQQAEQGLLGKLVVRASGKVELRMGDVTLEVDSGLPCSFGQEVVSIDEQSKQYCVLGPVSKRLVCTPKIPYDTRI